MRLARFPHECARSAVFNSEVRQQLSHRVGFRGEDPDSLDMRRFAPGRGTPGHLAFSQAIAPVGPCERGYPNLWWSHCRCRRFDGWIGLPGPRLAAPVHCWSSRHCTIGRPVPRLSIGAPRVFSSAGFMVFQARG